MVIDWIKVEEKPGKKQTIEGRLLLDLKTKIDHFKNKVAEKTNKLYQIEEDLLSMIEELNKTRIYNKTIIDKKDDIIRKLNLEIENLQKDLEENNSKVSKLGYLLKDKELKLLEVSTNSEQKISSINSALKSAHDKISELEDNLNSLNSKISPKDEEISNLTTKLKELEAKKSNLEAQLSEIKKLLLLREAKLQELTNTLDEKDKILEAQSIRHEEVEQELEDLKPPEIDKLAYSYEARITCPSCHAVGKDIRTVDDKKTVLSYIGNIPMYAKKYVCKKCDYNWK